MQGPLTAPHAVKLIEEALCAHEEKKLDILFYRKNGETFPNWFLQMVFCQNYTILHFVALKKNLVFNHIVEQLSLPKNNICNKNMDA